MTRHATAPPGSQPVPRGPGRPRASVPGAHVSAWVPEPTYDRIVERAKADRKSVSKLVADVMSRHVGSEPT